ncbi:hypothetical protein F511_47429 [Dorcoceras hygrometricum]|uniref:Uncharacterized protein n=1 Tax=Dorcoceras hygrometricum TaxID=472368 RepID=A0A2Z6ZR45_9LAMI|nr:hypothetical protein F511_47429 [Dorcoceras hygrometricum]
MLRALCSDAPIVDARHGRTKRRCWSRLLALWHEGGRPDVAPLRAWWRPRYQPLAHWLRKLLAAGRARRLVAGRPMCADDGARWGMIAQRLSRAKFKVAAAPAGRRSGYVVTADFF